MKSNHYRLLLFLLILFLLCFSDIHATVDTLLASASLEITELQLQQYYGVPVGTFPPEQVEQYASEMFLKKEEEMRKLYDKKYEDKVVQIIKEAVKLDTKAYGLIIMEKI